MKYLIVGGVAGGMSAATRLRRLDEQVQIIVVEKGPYVSFANCGLPYYLGGEITQRSDLLVKTAAQLTQRFKLDIRQNSEVLAINRAAQTVTIQTAQKTYQESYDRLILSTGAKPRVPAITGLSTAKHVYTLRNVPDIDQIAAQVADGQQAVVIGAGFIGLEITEALVHRGLTVTLIEQQAQILPPLDIEMAEFVKQTLVAHGVRVLTDTAVTAFEQAGAVLRLSDGQSVTTDLTILAVGVQPATTLAQKAGLTVGSRQGLVVDEHYQTSDPAIYAIGDAILVRQTTTQQPTLISLASPANRQGRQVADVLAGRPRLNRGSLGTAIVRVFDQVAGSTGLNETQLKQAGYDYQVVHIMGQNHAGYYPGAQPLWVKLLFQPQTGELFGAQVVGADGVDKRLDVLATAIKAQLTVDDLPELELSYAPPFGAAKDVINLAGYAAQNLMAGDSQTIQWHELAGKLAAGACLIDVRAAEEYQQGTIPHALNLPLDDLRNQLDQLSKKQTYIVSCASGLRGYLAERIMKQAGYQVVNLDGAYQLYDLMRAKIKIN